MDDPEEQMAVFSEGDTGKLSEVYNQWRKNQGEKIVVISRQFQTCEGGDDRPQYNLAVFFHPASNKHGH